jgi:hypothetical protein
MIAHWSLAGPAAPASDVGCWSLWRHDGENFDSLLPQVGLPGRDHLRHHRGVSQKRIRTGFRACQRRNLIGAEVFMQRRRQLWSRGMGGQPGKPKPPGNPPLRPEPQQPAPIEEPPRPIPIPPVERPPVPIGADRPSRRWHLVRQQDIRVLKCPNRLETVISSAQAGIGHGVVAHVEPTVQLSTHRSLDFLDRRARLAEPWPRVFLARI